LNQRSLSSQKYDDATEALNDKRIRGLPGFVIHLGPLKRTPFLRKLVSTRETILAKDDKRVLDEFWPEFTVKYVLYSYLFSFMHNPVVSLW